MSDATGRESLLGWARLGCGAALLFYVPAWGILTAAIAQINQDLWTTTIVVGDTIAFVERTWLDVFLIAGTSAALWLALLTAVLFFLSGIGRLLLAVANRVVPGDRERYAAMVGGDVALPGGDWKVQTVGPPEEGPPSDTDPPR